jgi:Cys-tRNA(Pro)/Cys-tRNA(Cys) deacylase
MSQSSTNKTQAMRLLEGKKVPYTAHFYDHQEFVSAVEVAQAIDMPPEKVFKTLVAEPDRGKPILAVIPANGDLDLKALAKAAGTKKVRMATQASAEHLTGLQKGGISALALINRGFQVFLDDNALEYNQIAMSAGERGAQVVLAPEDFLRLTRSQVGPISKPPAPRTH